MRRPVCSCSSFAEIFDVDHFIDVLRNEISIVKELPSDFSWSTREYYATGIRATRIKTAPIHASADWYLENVLPVLQRSVNIMILAYVGLLSPCSYTRFGTYTYILFFCGFC